MGKGPYQVRPCALLLIFAQQLFPSNFECVEGATYVGKCPPALYTNLALNTKSAMLSFGIYYQVTLSKTL